MAGSDDSQSPVGYKQPPLHTQFKPGRSGNTKGRPRGSKNFSTVIEQELRARIEVTENGRRKRITKREAIAKQTVNRAAAGDAKATSTLLNEARFQESQSQPITQNHLVSAEDQMVMDNILQRIRLSQPACLGPELPAGESSAEQPTTSIESREGEL